MNTRLTIALASITLLLTAGCNKESVPFKEAQPTTITEPIGVRPRYYWRQGNWAFSRKAGGYVWQQGQWVHKRKHTKWVQGRWVDTARGKRYLEGHWE
ncbi:MAG: hypothetical protein WDO14_03275 [Bacteroidota bacterium]